MTKIDPTKPTWDEFPRYYNNLMESFNDGDDMRQLIQVLANAYGVNHNIIKDKITNLTNNKKDQQLNSSTKQDNQHEQNNKQAINMTETKTELEQNIEKTASPFDFKAELEKCQARGGGDFFKATEGKNVITFLDNGGAEYSKTYDNRPEPVTQRDFKIQVTNKDVKDKECVWSLTVGGLNSLYGKVISFGAEKGQLIGNKVTLMREGLERTNTKYILDISDF